MLKSFDYSDAVEFKSVYLFLEAKSTFLLWLKFLQGGDRLPNRFLLSARNSKSSEPNSTNTNENVNILCSDLKMQEAYEHDSWCRKHNVFFLFVVVHVNPPPPPTQMQSIKIKRRDHYTCYPAGGGRSKITRPLQIVLHHSATHVTGQRWVWPALLRHEHLYPLMF